MSLSKKINFGILLVRTALVILLLSYCLPRLLDGGKAWIEVGKIFGQVGFLPYQFLGLLVLILLLGSVFSLISGFLFDIFMIITSILLLLFSLRYFSLAMPVLSLYALTVAIICFSLIYIGTGAYVVSISIKKNSRAI